MISAEFFDIFGLIAFAFLVVIATWALKTKKKLPKWSTIIILKIGLLGLIAEGYVVIKTFILGG